MKTKLIACVVLLAALSTGGCMSMFHRFHADDVEILQTDVKNIISHGAWFLRGDILDEHNVCWGFFEISERNEEFSCEKGWKQYWLTLTEMEYIKYIDGGNDGDLVIKVPGYSEDCICTITDADWESISGFVSKWKSRAKFIREEKK